MAAKAESHSAGPWREARLEWTEREYIQKRNDISSRTPLLDETNTYKILLCGPVAAGKSSMINTIYSAIRGKIGEFAYRANSETSVTKKFRVYRFREKIKERAMRVTICDTMGFEEKEDRGPSLRDIKHIIDGRINDGYEFEPNESVDITSAYLNPQPGPMDKVHVIAIVVDSVNVEHTAPHVMEKLHAITEHANEKDIRWALVLTKIDEVSTSIKSDVTSVHSDKDMENAVEAASQRFNIDQSKIFPMQNYARAIIPSVPVNILALHTLEHILDLADNTLESQRGALPQDETPPDMELLPSPWRSEDPLSEQGVQTMWAELASIEPNLVPKLRICLMGPSGGGKSAFINSAMSEMYQRIVSFADTACESHPTTTSYSEYVMSQGRDGDELDVILCDTVGVLPTGRINTEDIVSLLNGEKANQTKAWFGSNSPVPLSDRPHVLCLVLNGAEIDSYSSELIEKLQNILITAKSPSIKLLRVVLVTHIDKVCGHVAADPTKVFRSQEVKKCLEKVRQKLGVPLPDIWPVVNFADDTEVDWRKSALILQALNQLVDRAQDYIHRSSVEVSTRKKYWIF